MYILGLDIGSVFTKAALIKERNIISYDTGYSRGDFQNSAATVMASTFKKANVSERDVFEIFSTGCGGEMVPRSKELLNDISCQARGVNFFFPSIRTIIEIGARSTKVVKVNGQGSIVNFAVSERCAATSGKFLQLISRITEIDIGKMGEVSLQSNKGVKFTTGCAVFAETEVISRIAEGIPVRDIVAGIHEIMAHKIFNLLQGIDPEEGFAVTGGGAKDVGLIKAIENKLDTTIYIPPEPFITAALGAALIGKEKAASKLKNV